MTAVHPLYPVGYLCLNPHFCIAVYGQKPRAFHLWAMRTVFGWTWKDAA